MKLEKAFSNRILTEEDMGFNTTDSAPPVNKKDFLMSLKEYSSYGRLFRNDVNEYKQILERIRSIVDGAEQVTLTETDGWFDKITVSRHLKQLKENFKVFEKTIQEAAQISQRLNSSYEDMGKLLQNYYEVE